MRWVAWFGIEFVGLVCFVVACVGCASVDGRCVVVRVGFASFGI